MENDTELDFELDETVEDQTVNNETADDVITLSKKDYSKLDRKARAYDATKQNKQETTTPRKQSDTSSDAKYDRLELKIDGYSDDSIDFIMKNGGKESLQNQYVMTAVQSIQDQKKAENAVVSNETTKSDVERKFSQEEIQAMSPEELYKVLPKARK